jgi:hypothetical protein
MIPLSIAILLTINILLPINCGNRNDISEIQLTHIGQFGVMRKAREGVPAHFHTGIDIKRPGGNYNNEPIFPIAEGKIISKRTDGPYAQIIIEHDLKGLQFWSLYEHIAGIMGNVGDFVDPQKPIASFMSRDELDRYGWQFDHFHLEVIRIKPLPINPDPKNPERFFNSYSLICYTPDDLEKYYFDPIEFLKSFLQ